MDDRYVSISQLIEDHCSVSDEMVRYWIRHEGCRFTTLEKA